MATAIAAVAIAVFVVLSMSSSGTSSHDAYTNQANRLCRIAAHKIAAARRSYREATGRSSLDSFAESLAWIIGDVRAQLGTLAASSDRVDRIVAMEDAMLESESRLIRVAQQPSQAVVAARRVGAAAARVKDTASSLGLVQCGRLSLGVS